MSLNSEIQDRKRWNERTQMKLKKTVYSTEIKLKDINLPSQDMLKIAPAIPDMRDHLNRSDSLLD